MTPEETVAEGKKSVAQADFCHLFSEDEDFAMGYFKGHLDLAECHIVAIQLFGDEPPLKIQHDVVRLVPRQNKDFELEFLEGQRGPGSFLATVVKWE